MNDPVKYSPPRWADRFLEWYCNPRLLEQIQGDVHELYHWRVAEKGSEKANKAFVWDVVRFFRWRNIRKVNTQKQQFNNMGMFKNYMKIGWRNLLNQKVPSVINIFGLSCAIACCLVAYLFIEGVWLKGAYHENKDEIHLVTHTSEYNKEVQKYGYSSAPLANLFEEQFASVQHAVRVRPTSAVVKYKNETFSERIHYVDPDFMEMFTYPVVYGSNKSLREINQVIITETVAAKFFRTTHPIGEEIVLTINGTQKIMTVSCVIKDLPSTAMFRFGILVNYDAYRLTFPDHTVADKWAEQQWLFIQVPKGNDLSSVTNGFDRLVKTQNDARPDHKYLDLQLEPFSTIVQNSQNTEGGPGHGAPLAPQILLATIALFMLILAVFNYINIAVLMAKKRVKEIGVRKVIGGRKSQLVFQFLSENLITCFLAIVLGGVIASTLLLPGFNEIATKNLQIDLFNNMNLWVVFGSLLVFITLASGAYPALYISSFKPVMIFRGIQEVGNKNKFTNVLLAFQFILAMITIVAGIAFIRTNNSNAEKDWGYNNESKIFANIPSDKSYFRLKNVLSQQPNIVEITGSDHHLGKYVGEEIATLANEEYEIMIIRGEANYAGVMDIRLMQGRLFDPALESDVISGLVVNQTFINQLGLSFPTEELITIDSTKHNIIGVVEDFHYYNFAHSINPVAILAMPDSGYNYLTVKVEEGTASQMASVVKEAWHKEVEGELYYGGEQLGVFDRYFRDMVGLRNVLLFTAVLAVILSAMGLFGLVSLNLTSRMKDFSIRRILGANTTDLSKTVYKRFLTLWIIGCLVGGGIATFLITALLDSIYAYHSAIGVIPIVIAICILLSVMIVTIASQLVKVKNANPVDILRVNS